MKNNIFMTPKEVQQLLNISAPTEKKWRDTGDLPSPVRMGRRVFYRIQDLNNRFKETIKERSNAL
jgi:predicted site-specific integrase-resolvase